MQPRINGIVGGPRRPSRPNARSWSSRATALGEDMSPSGESKFRSMKCGISTR